MLSIFKHCGALGLFTCYSEAKAADDIQFDYIVSMHQDRTAKSENVS